MPFVAFLLMITFIIAGFVLFFRLPKREYDSKHGQVVYGRNIIFPCLCWGGALVFGVFGIVSLIWSYQLAQEVIQEASRLPKLFGITGVLPLLTLLSEPIRRKRNLAVPFSLLSGVFLALMVFNWWLEGGSK